MNHQLYDSNMLIPLEDRDRELEELWRELGGVPFDEDEDGRLVLSEEWLHFPAGTWNEEIWKWFDSRYSRGVYHLIYSFDGVDRTDRIAKLTFLSELCFECTNENCVFNRNGECKFALVNERRPNINRSGECQDICYTF